MDEVMVPGGVHVVEQVGEEEFEGQGDSPKQRPQQEDEEGALEMLEGEHHLASLRHLLPATTIASLALQHTPPSLQFLFFEDYELREDERKPGNINEKGWRVYERTAKFYNHQADISLIITVP